MNRQKRRAYALLRRNGAGRSQKINQLPNSPLSPRINHPRVIYSYAETTRNRSHPTHHHSRGDFLAVSCPFCVGLQDGIMPSQASAIKPPDVQEVKISCAFPVISCVTRHYNHSVISRFPRFTPSCPFPK